MSLSFTPTDTKALLTRADQFSGWSFHEVAEYLQISPPLQLKTDKGWCGQCVEQLLGASGGNQPTPDFAHLGIELKTIPIKKNAEPLESTYICTAPIPFRETIWEHSRVYQKIRHILWVPIIIDKTQSLLDRRLGQAYLWSPDPQEMGILQQDWEELTEYLMLGHFEEISARLGTYLHLRPKAANSRHPIQTINHDGAPIYIVPKGFYLRTTFTRSLLARYYKNSS